MKIEIPTPMGVIVLGEVGDSNYPGVYINFRPNGEIYERSVALFEHSKDKMQLHIWGEKGNINDDSDVTESITIYDEKDLEEGHELTVEDLLDWVPDSILSVDDEQTILTDTRTGIEYDVSIQRHVREENIVDAIYISYWDGESTVLPTACKVNLLTKEVFDITPVGEEMAADLGQFDKESVVINEKEYPVYERDEYEGREDTYWRV